MCAPSELQFGALREDGGTREAGSTVDSRGEPGSVLSGGYAPDSVKAEDGSIVDEPREAEPLCARIKGVDGEVSGGKLMSDHGLFSSYEDHKKRRTGKIRGAFSRMHGALDGWMLARAPASLAQGLHHHGPRYFNFPYFCTMCDLEKLGLVDQIWLERNLSALLLRMLVVGRRQQSESIEAARYEVRRFDEPF